MELTAYYDRGNDIVVAKPVAEITAENIKLGALKILKIAEKNHCCYLLVDLRKCPIGHSLVEGFLTMQNMKKSTGLSYKYKVAIVYDPTLYPDDRANFIETIVANRANPSFKMFKKTTDAMKWLKEIKKHVEKDKASKKLSG